MFDANAYFIASVLSIIFPFGVFGSVNIIIATIWSKSLHNRCNILMALLAVADLGSLLGEVQSIYRIFTNQSETTQRICFYSIPYMLFSHTFQTYLIWAISFDRLLAIKAPIKYKNWSSHKYLGILVAPGILYASTSVLYGAVSLEEANENITIAYCNPPRAFTAGSKLFWNRSNLLLNALVILTYATAYYAVWKMRRRKQTQHTETMQKILSSLTVIIVVYICSWTLANIMLFISLTVIGDEYDPVSMMIESYAGIPANISFACNYYVYYWRSTEYRSAFKQQLNRMNCLKTKKVTETKRSDIIMLDEMKIIQAEQNELLYAYCIACLLAENSTPV